MSYIQGFVVAVPTGGKQAYVDMAAKAATLFMEYGAERLVECWGDDVPDGEVTDFKRAVQATADETVVFSWIVWPDRGTYKAAQSRMEADERMAAMGDAPFDMKRMIFAGFVPIFDTADREIV